MLFKDENKIDQYLNNGTWRIKENANHIFCVGHLMNYVSAVTIKDYWLNNVFSKKARKFHESGKIHIHDLSRMTPYCVGFSTSEVIKHGLKGPKGRIISRPPKHMSSAINQLTNFVGVISQEFAGAIALNDFAMYLAPFVYYDKLSSKEVKQEIQQFIFHMNQPNRWAGECPFTNITINASVPNDMKDVKIWIDGEQKNKVYGEFENEMHMITEAILEVLIEGDANGTPLTFPVLTVGVSEDFPWESDIAKKIFQVTAKYGTPFFENFKKETGRDPSDSRSMCCRLNMDIKEIRRHTGGIFGNADSMGSLGVVTINLNRIGYEAKNSFMIDNKLTARFVDYKDLYKKEYYKLIDEAMDVASSILIKRRTQINKMFDMRLYPYTELYLKNYKNFFSTIGIIGGNESMVNFMDKTMMEQEAIDFMEELTEYMVTKTKEYQESTGHLYNLEAVPGEGAMYSLARKDVEAYKDIYVSGKDEPFLTNSALPPVEETDFLKVVRTQEKLQTMYSGGTTLNIYIGEKLGNYKQAKELVKTIIENTKIPYFSITPIYSLCREHGYIDGEKFRCPTCNKNTEIFSRVVGYLKPRNNYNKGKTEEFKVRKYYDISDIKKLGEKNES